MPGFECGISLANFNDIKPGDVIEAFATERVAPRSFRSRPARCPSIGVLTLELRLDDSHSLKDKRHVVKSLKDRLRDEFNVAVAEIDYQDLWQRGLIAAVTVSPDQAFAEQVLQSVEREAASLLGAFWWA